MPLAFVGTMAVAGALRWQATACPMSKPESRLSVLAIGATIALRVPCVPTIVAMAAAGLPAVFHGQAHGAEMPRRSPRLVVAWASLARPPFCMALASVDLRLIARPQSQAGQVAVRLIGAAAAFAGVMMLARAA